MSRAILGGGDFAKAKYNRSALDNGIIATMESLIKEGKLTGIKDHFDDSKGKTGHTCWNCKKNIAIGSQILIGKGSKQFRIPMTLDTKLYSGV